MVSEGHAHFEWLRMPILDAPDYIAPSNYIMYARARLLEPRPLKFLVSCSSSLLNKKCCYIYCVYVVWAKTSVGSCNCNQNERPHQSYHSDSQSQSVSHHRANIIWDSQRQRFREKKQKLHSTDSIYVIINRTHHDDELCKFIDFICRVN